MRFEWNAAKNRANQKKHGGLDFETASRVFRDAQVVLAKDRVVDGEQRWHAIGEVLTAVLRYVSADRRKKMARKSSASSRRGKRVSVSAEPIWNKPLSKRQEGVLKGISQRQAAGDDSEIDFSDIPELSEEQLRSGRRPAKRLVAVRLDPDVLEWLKQYGEGYSSRINNILRAVMSRQ